MSAGSPNPRPAGAVRKAFETYDSALGHLDTLARWFIGLSLFGVFLLLVLQVLVRYVFPFPVPWVEEAAVYLSGYIAMIGASVCLRAGYHLQVDLLRDMLGTKAQFLLLSVQQLLVAAFGLFLLRYGMAFVQIGWGQTSPSSYFFVSYARMAMPIGGTLLMLQALVMAGRALIGFNDARLPPVG